ncbi:MAG: amidohydrolase family protein [Bacillota bacterium]
MDLTRIPVIDNHCHLFSLSGSDQNLVKTLSLSLHDMPEEQLTSTLIYRKVLKELGEHLGVSGSEKEILKKRQSTIEEDYKSYVSRLFTEVFMHTLLVDLGYKPAEVSLEEFEDLVPCKIRYVYRIETVVDEMWRQGLSLAAAEEKFYEALAEAKTSLSPVAFKSIIGYRTGLDIRKANRGELKKGFRDEKEFRDYFLLKAIEKAAEYNIPVQIHASFGESNINLLVNNPLLLKRVFEDPDYMKTDIVLVHGGYPYSFEAGYLAAMYPNVYLDMSEMVPFVPLGLRRGLRDMVDMCPLNKLMYGSDGFVLPELHWLGAKVAKKEIGLLLSELVQEGYFDLDYALAAAENIFFNTAKKVFRLRD